MFAAYRYAFVKSLRLKSTWIILIIAALLTMGLAGILPFSVPVGKAEVTDTQKNNLSVILSYTAIGSTMVILTAVFAGFRGATVFKDEVEDGSFLIMISKPINRSSLILAKWFAYLTILFFFSLVMALFHAMGIGIGSKSSVAASVIFRGIGIEFAIGMVFALIFGSIALLLSTILSSTQTAISTLIIGVLAPITSIIQTITTAPRYVEVQNGPGSLQFFLSHIKKDDATNNTRPENSREFTERLLADINANAANNPIQSLALVTVFKDIGVLSQKNIDSFSAIAQVIAQINQDTTLTPTQKEERIKIEAEKIATELTTNIEIQANITKFFASKFFEDTGTTDPYKKYVFIDFNYQATQLTSFILDYVYSPTEISGYASLNSGRIGQTTSERIQGWELEKDDLTNLVDSLAVLSPADTQYEPDWAADKKNVINNLFSPTAPGAADKKLYTADYKPFANKDYILAAYIVIAIILAPISLVIVSRKNFR